MEKAALPLRKSEAKILLVDDRADNLISIEAILEKGNYTIVKANSGKAALKVLLNDHDFSSEAFLSSISFCKNSLAASNFFSCSINCWFLL